MTTPIESLAQAARAAGFCVGDVLVPEQCAEVVLDDGRSASLCAPWRSWAANKASELITLAGAALHAKDTDCQEHDDACNAFAEAALACMSDAQRARWDSWCLKATWREVIEEALVILGLLQVAR